MTVSHPARTRVAPSPTGDPHVGTAYQAVFNKALAQATGGSFILRVEDTDRTRSTKASEEMIFRALHWLSLDWNEGPDVGGPHAPYRQSERTEAYRVHADRLLEVDAAYRCFCTPERLEGLRAAQVAAKQPPRYDRNCSAIDAETSRARAKTEAFVVRLRVPSEGRTVVRDELRGEVVFENVLIDDQVLLKSDGFPTYHLANVVDDHLMEITHVIRGEEWLPSTPKHLLLYRAFRWDPPLFFHTPLLRNPDRSKFSKRKNPTSLDWYRDQGFLPEALVNFLATLGWSHPDGADQFGWAEFLERFSLDRMNLGGPIFDLAKLTHLNGLWIRAMAPTALTERIVGGGYTEHRAAAPELLRGATELIHDRLTRLAEFDELTAFFFDEPTLHDVKELASKSTPDAVRASLLAVIEGLATCPEWSAAAVEGVIRGVAEAGPLAKRELFMAVRVAATGRTVSTPLFETIAVLGREAAGRRLRAAAELR